MTLIDPCVCTSETLAPTGEHKIHKAQRQKKSLSSLKKTSFSFTEDDNLTKFKNHILNPNLELIIKFPNLLLAFLKANYYPNIL
ncbi:hypothetical protein ASD98_08560 [Flavobacterium sp. Root186]|nr:hypothetical protein ASD98_08560 [Flavobacterium sp. Root186]